MITLFESSVYPGDEFTARFCFRLRFNPRNTRDPYVVHLFNFQDGGYHTGGYHSRIKSAIREYETRCAREELDPRLPFDKDTHGDEVARLTVEHARTLNDPGDPDLQALITLYEETKP